MEEEQARAFLDADGALRDASEAPLSEAASYLVFSQAGGAQGGYGTVLDVPAWQRQATRFFDTRIGLAIARARDVAPRERDAYLFLVEPPNMPIARRLLFLRPRTPDDLFLAEHIEAMAVEGARGLGALAARCHGACFVESQGPEDRAALVLAALAASMLLGPIVPPSRDAIFGVRTAREKLDELSRTPYR